ncbi:MAG: TIGR00730 family Rossman fold protein [Dehalococcoidales bacterium]|nr:TIGR00730 family Rossman fold protein [Dehalococcoidales bacterium]
MQQYEINDLAKEESWRMFRIIGELVEGFDTLTGIEPAVTIYGSARLSPEDALYAKTEDIAYRLGNLGFAVFTGGGPGVMEAANKGALRSDSMSIGLNIELPHEQSLNRYTNLSIMFHHFFVRKVMLVKYASAFICMPGGLGTMDEVTEVLTLIQTRKIKPFPVILVDSDYWKGLISWLKSTMLKRGFISPEDLNLLRVCDEPEEVIELVQNWHTKQEAPGISPVQPD